MSDYRDWLFTVDAPIATLTLNRPDTNNDLAAETLYELRDITARLRSDKKVWVVIVRGEGSHFSTGMDLGVIRRFIGLPEQVYRDSLRDLQQCLDEFESLEKPTIARLHGFCIGGGLLLALCCDFRLASERTIFALPEVRMGLGVIMGTARISRIAGVAATKEMVLLGERFHARAAEAYGLVHKVLPSEDLDRAVIALAEKFRKLPPRTIGIAKRIIDRGQALSLRESQELEIDAQAELRDSPDFHEAVASYLDKRQPRFTGG